MSVVVFLYLSFLDRQLIASSWLVILGTYLAGIVGFYFGIKVL